MSNAVTDEMIAAAKAAYWHEVHHGGGYSDKCYEAAIVAAAFASPDARRYRWLKMQSSVGDQIRVMQSTPWTQWDEAIDAALAKEAAPNVD